MWPFKKKEYPPVRYPGAGAPILGNNPGIKTKEEADRVISIFLGRIPPENETKDNLEEETNSSN